MYRYDVRFNLTRGTSVPLNIVFVAVALGCLAGSAQAQSNFQRLRSFGNASQVGVMPNHGLLLGADGALYGTSANGPPPYSGPGVLFKVNTNGTGYTVLHLFTGGSDGQGPTVPIQGRDGALYGATAGGTNNGGTIFKINPDGSGYAVLYSFSLQGGHSPNQPLLQGVDGMLYGVTSAGGNYNAGTIFKLSTDGTGYADLYHFGSKPGDGNSPNALMQARDGALYGTCSSGWTTNAGTVYKINTDGSGYALLYSFPGAKPQAALIEGSDGELYGTTSSPFSDNPGSVFKLRTDGSGFTVLHDFIFATSDGSRPEASLWQAPDGTLYGTTITGGPSGGYGTVFKMGTDGAGYSILHSFGLSEYNNSDPNGPYGIVPGSNGELYCVSGGGGTSGLGAIFTIRTNGTGYAVLHNFNVTGGDPANPLGDLIQGRDGALYETSYGGGNAGGGCVFTIQTNGTGLAMLLSFGCCHDGLYTYAGLLQADDDALYGTSYIGGSNTSGALFKMNPDGSGFTVIYNFGTTTNDGRNPLAALMKGTDGALYGTTIYGGNYGGGTVFKVNPDGNSFITLHHFTFSAPPVVVGEGPACKLLQANDGLLYGTTTQGGSDMQGTVFRLSTTGTDYAVLHTFQAAGGDGQNPAAGVIQGNDGVLYGNSAYGGTSGAGTVYKLNPDGSGYTRPS